MTTGSKAKRHKKTIAMKFDKSVKNFDKLKTQIPYNPLNDTWLFYPKHTQSKNQQNQPKKTTKNFELRWNESEPFE